MAKLQVSTVLSIMIVLSLQHLLTLALCAGPVVLLFSLPQAPPA
jgi:hypothetical protein